jgi:hypothetical protein
LMTVKPAISWQKVFLFEGNMNYLINRLKEPSTGAASSWSLPVSSAIRCLRAGNRHRWRRSAGWRCWCGDAGQR